MVAGLLRKRPGYEYPAGGFPDCVASSVGHGGNCRPELAYRAVGRPGLAIRYSRGLVLGATALFSGAMVLVGTNVEEPALAIACFTFGFGTAPSIFALTYLVIAETTTIGQRGAMLQYSNAILTSAGLFAPAVVGMLVGSASSAVVGFEHAFVLTGAMMFGSGLLSLLFINQQRDRKRLGLDV